MPVFKCTYRDKHGKLMTDTQSARDRSALISELRKQSLFPISVEETSTKKSIQFFSSRISSKDVVTFTRQLSNLLTAGVNLSRALNMLVDYTKEGPMKKIVAQLRDSVDGGGTLWQALSRYPKVFSSLYVSMVKAGELGENLEEVLNHLASYLERSREQKNVLLSMLVYPSVLFFVGIAVVAFILTFVFPRLSFMFTNVQDKPLPGITQFFMATSQFLVDSWLFIAGFFLIVSVVAWRLLKVEKVRLRWDEVIFKLPYFGEIIQNALFVRFSQILSLVLANGVAIVDALDIATGVIQNKFVVKEMTQVKNRVYHGASLSDGLKRVNVFHPLTVNMVSVGEETGKLEETLQKLSEIYDKEVQEQVKRFISLSEPILIFALAFIVGFLVMAILLPIFQMDMNIV